MNTVNEMMLDRIEARGTSSERQMVGGTLSHCDRGTTTPSVVAGVSTDKREEIFVTAQRRV